MKKTRFTEEQIVRIVQESRSESAAVVARKHGVSEQTLYNVVLGIYMAIASWALFSAKGPTYLATQEKIPIKGNRTLLWYLKFLFACYAVAFAAMMFLGVLSLPFAGYAGFEAMFSPERGLLSFGCWFSLVAFGISVPLKRMQSNSLLVPTPGTARRVSYNCCGRAAQQDVSCTKGTKYENTYIQVARVVQNSSAENTPRCESITVLWESKILPSMR